MNKILLSVFLLIAIFSTCTTYAQKKDGIAPTPITATITASGTVLSPMSITSTRDLLFGTDILPGIRRTIDKSSNSSGKFSIMGQPGKEISITITSPGSLTFGANTLPLAFTETDAGYKLPGETMVDFDPANTATAVFGNDGTMDIFLGGTVVPDFSQVAGNYTGNITVVFYYTGN